MATTAHPMSTGTRLPGSHRGAHARTASRRVLMATVIGTGLLLTGCTNDEPTTASVSASPAGASVASPAANPGGTAPAASNEPAREPNADVTEEQQALLDELLATPLALAEVQERIEAAGYTSRVVEIDGEPQPATMDYRLDRVNLVVNDGLVTDAFWG